VRVAGSGQSERLLQCALPGRAVEEVGPAHDVRNTLQGIVDDHRKLVGKSPIPAADDDIPALPQPEITPSLEAILHRDDDVLDPETSGCRAGARRPIAAGTGVTALTIVLATRAAALESRAERLQFLEGVCVMRAALALVLDRTVPVETEELECAQDLLGAPGHFARAIEILHPHEPAPTTAAGIRVATERSHQRSEMK